MWFGAFVNCDCKLNPYSLILWKALFEYLNLVSMCGKVIGALQKKASFYLDQSMLLYIFNAYFHFYLVSSFWWKASNPALLRPVFQAKLLRHLPRKKVLDPKWQPAQCQATPNGSEQSVNGSKEIIICNMYYFLPIVVPMHRQFVPPPQMCLRPWHAWEWGKAPLSIAYRPWKTLKSWWCHQPGQKQFAQCQRRRKK